MPLLMCTSTLRYFTSLTTVNYVVYWVTRRHSVCEYYVTKDLFVWLTEGSTDRNSSLCDCF
jgi:hypothetical protein